MTPDDPRREWLVQAIEIISTGRIPDQPTQLTRRNRDIVVAADQWEDRASVWFVRRGHSGEPVDEFIHLEHDGLTWTSNGGSSGGPGADLSRHRLTMVELANHFSRQYHHDDLEQIPFAVGGGGSYSPGHATIQFQSVAEAATLSFSDREPRQIADHGYCLVAYTPKRPPTITAFDASGNDLGSFTPQRPARPGRPRRFSGNARLRRTRGGANGRWRRKRR